ncbi:MAG: tail fiber protein [Verrucomicrobia bacterium]|nr:tail fiber protein [Verrucomicrobiota bacterium]
MRSTSLKTLLQALSLAAATHFAASSLSAEDAPKLLPFQGVLTDADGNSVSNGVRLVLFRVYSDPASGTPVWAGELHRTTVNGGLVNVMLGAKTPFTGVDFNSQLYLEITVDINGDNAITAADPPMLPRQAILPALYAKESTLSRNSLKLAGADCSDLMSNGNNPADPNNFVRGAKIEPNSLKASHIGPDAISNEKIQDAAVSASKLAYDVINQLIPPGSIMAYGGSYPPQGWFACDGGVVSRSAFPRLFAAIGTAWGVGDFSGQDFQLPDLRGQFVRGADRGSGRDPDRASRVGTLGGNSGDAVGTYQWHQLGYHSHGISTTGGIIEQRAGGPAPGFDNPGDYFAPLGYSTITVLPAGGNETRPINASVLYIIKY